MKKITIADMVIFLFILATLGDIVSTSLATIKHSSDVESNPLNVMGIPIWGLLLIKIVIYSLFVFLIYGYYSKVRVFLRFFMVYFLFLFLILQVAVTINNMLIYRMPVEEVQPLPEQERIDAYVDGVGNLGIITKSIENISPTFSEQTYEIPLIFSMFLYNLFIFWIWYCFERRFDMYGLK